MLVDVTDGNVSERRQQVCELQKTPNHPRLLMWFSVIEVEYSGARLEWSLLGTSSLQALAFARSSREVRSTIHGYEYTAMTIG